MSTPPRRGAIALVEARYFDPLILVTIMCNCFTMAWESPLDPDGTRKAAFIDVCEWVYLYIFTFELLSKVLAYGFMMNRHAYLRDSWCQLDFTVVTLAWLPIVFPSFGNYSVIRAFRALRPLRALKRVPGMPKLVGSILQVTPKQRRAVASGCRVDLGRKWRGVVVGGGGGGGWVAVGGWGVPVMSQRDESPPSPYRRQSPLSPTSVLSADSSSSSSASSAWSSSRARSTTAAHCQGLSLARRRMAPRPRRLPGGCCAAAAAAAVAAAADASSAGGSVGAGRRAYECAKQRVPSPSP